MEYTKKKTRLIVWALLIGCLLTISKFVAYYITQSNVVLTDALESIINIVAGAFAFYSIYLAARPKDRNHPYGHGKIEFFAVGFEGALIFLAGIVIIYNAVSGILSPQNINRIEEGVIITAVAGVINFVLGIFLKRKGKELKSMTLEADGQHLLADSYTSAGLVLGLLIIKWTGFVLLDSLLAMALGLIILYNGYKLLRKSVSGLMDEVDLSLVKQIVAVLQVNRKSDWIDIHNLRAQKYGADLHIDCHLTLPYYYDLNQMHDEVTRIEQLIVQKQNTGVELFIHVDPCIPECCSYCNVQNCEVREMNKIRDIEWNLENVMNNTKHFSS